MSKVVPFPTGDGKQRARDKAKRRAKGRTLCDRGFHKWSVDTQTRFDTQRGKLVTLVRCVRCDATRSELR